MAVGPQMLKLFNKAMCDKVFHNEGSVQFPILSYSTVHSVHSRVEEYGVLHNFALGWQHSLSAPTTFDFDSMANLLILVDCNSV